MVGATERSAYFPGSSAQPGAYAVDNFQAGKTLGYLSPMAFEEKRLADKEGLAA
jgi:hypothetical protein